MKKLNNQEKAVIGVLIIAGFWVYWKYLYKPITSEITKLQEELSQKQSQLEATRQAAQELEVLQAEFKILEIEAREMEKKLPKSKELPKLIRDITRSLEKYRLSVQSFVPGKEMPKPYFSEIPITLQLTGSYHNLANFLAEIGQYERVINTYDVVLTPKVPSKESPDSMSASLKLVTYMAK
ncbi:MAG: type 4a pilus biogenesis protein PilO [Elusimicrobia bacterium]|nr:type 4a pilus biogenesis protein PilO [Elusimicrobiota bacterium]